MSIQLTSIAPPLGLLFPPPTLLFLFSAPNSPFSLTANNLLAIASLVPASIDSSVPDDLTGPTGDYLTGTLAVHATFSEMAEAYHHATVPRLSRRQAACFSFPGQTTHRRCRVSGLSLWPY
jgi:hypothetical protein